MQCKNMKDRVGLKAIFPSLIHQKEEFLMFDQIFQSKRYVLLGYKSGFQALINMGKNGQVAIDGSFRVPQGFKQVVTVGL